MRAASAGGVLLKRFIAGIALIIAALAALLMWSPQAMDGVRHGLSVCAEVIIPSLFPFFVLGAAAGELGIWQRLAKCLGRPMSRLFGVSGAGAGALILGVTGGYPLGAASAADLAERGIISRAECERLLGFCNNSGPAFLIGAAGVGVFGSVRAGIVLYAAHVLAALTTGVLMRGKSGNVMSTTPPFAATQPGAFARAVTASVRNILNVCGFVVIFSAITAALDAAGITPRLAGELAVRANIELGTAKALVTGFFELGGGMSALRACSATRLNFALTALMIGWGGISVHAQTAAVIAAVKPRAARHLAGRLLSAVFSAAYAFLLYSAAF